MLNTHLVGLFLGIVVGAIDCALFLMGGAPLSSAMVAVALAFWASVGWAIHAAPRTWPAAVHGIAIAWLLNLPWLIEYAVLQGQTDLAIPMVVLATVFGAALGLVSAAIRRTAPTGPVSTDF